MHCITKSVQMSIPSTHSLPFWTKTHCFGQAGATLPHKPKCPGTNEADRAARLRNVYQVLNDELDEARASRRKFAKDVALESVMESLKALSAEKRTELALLVRCRRLAPAGPLVRSRAAARPSPERKDVSQFVLLLVISFHMVS